MVSDLSLKKKKICQFVIGLTFLGISSGERKEKWLTWCGPYQKTKDESDDKLREAHFNVEINLATK